MKKYFSLALFTFFSLILLIRCSEDGSLNFKTTIDNTDYTAFENFNYFVGVNNQTKFILHGINGSIKISPTDDIAATISGERKVQSESTADASAYLEFLKVVVEDRGDEVYVYTDQPQNTDGRILTVTYTIKIPSNWTTDITNINGGLQIDSLNGTIQANTVNGSIVLNAISGDVDLKLENGTIISEIMVADDGTCKMDLTNGTIDLSIPETTNATLNANVVNGSVNVADLTVQNVNSSTTSFNGTLGSGTATIDITAVNGEINVSGY